VMMLIHGEPNYATAAAQAAKKLLRTHTKRLGRTRETSRRTRK
jgi:hypothetical protein